MGFGLNPGPITDGPSADSYKQIIPSRYNVLAGGQIFKGQAFKRNLLSVVGANYNIPLYSQGDQAVFATNAASGFVAGVYSGNNLVPITNTVVSQVGIPLVRQGVTPVRVAALQGGTAVTVGSIIGFSAAVGASTFDVPTVQGSYVIGAAIGYVTGYQINTTLTANLATTGSQTVMVASTTGITTATALTIDYSNGNIQETVTPSAVSGQIRANAAITLAGTAGAGTVLTATVNGVTATYTTTASDTTLTIAAASFAKAINASAIVYGSNAVVAPANSVAAQVIISALLSGPNGNAITISTTATGGTVTSTAASSTLTSGAYGTITGTFQYAHGVGATISGQNLVTGASLIPAPGATGAVNVDYVLVDVAIVGA